MEAPHSNHQSAKTINNAGWPSIIPTPGWHDPAGMEHVMQLKAKFLLQIAADASKTTKTEARRADMWVNTVHGCDESTFIVFNTTALINKTRKQEGLEPVHSAPADLRVKTLSRDVGSGQDMCLFLKASPSWHWRAEELTT